MIHIKLTKTKLNIKYIKNNIVEEELILETKYCDAIVITDVISSFLSNCLNVNSRPNVVNGFNFSSDQS